MALESFVSLVEGKMWQTCNAERTEAAWRGLFLHDEYIVQIGVVVRNVVNLIAPLSIFRKERPPSS